MAFTSEDCHHKHSHVMYNTQCDHVVPGGLQRDRRSVVFTQVLGMMPGQNHLVTFPHRENLIKISVNFGQAVQGDSNDMPHAIIPPRLQKWAPYGQVFVTLSHTADQIPNLKSDSCTKSNKRILWYRSARSFSVPQDPATFPIFLHKELHNSASRMLQVEKFVSRRAYGEYHLWGKPG